jgi:hypothetical protein
MIQTTLLNANAPARRIRNRSKDLTAWLWLVVQTGMSATLALLPGSLASAVELETLQAIPERSVTYQWVDAAKEKNLPEGATIEVDAEHGSVLKITSTGGQNPSMELYTIKNPSIQSRAYVLHGYVRYEGMKHHKQIGFLEMWNTFQSGSYFTRGLAPSGPMMQLMGSSGWRRFELPFLISEEGFEQPKKLQFNVNFPDLAESETGVIWISDLTLTECQNPGGTTSLSTNFNLANPFLVWLVGLAIFAAIAFFIFLFVQSTHRRKQSEELRRMQAMDFAKK